MIKRTLPFLLSIIITLSITACSTAKNSENTVNISSNTANVIKQTSAQLSFSCDTIDQLTEKAQLILTGEISGTYKEYFYIDQNFTEISIKVNDIYKGQYSGKQIKILQTGTLKDVNNQSNLDEMSEYNSLLGLSKGTKVLLFLEKGDSPFTDDKIAYVPLGLYQGTYIIDGTGKIETSLKGKNNSKFYGRVVKDVVEKYSSIDKVESKVKGK